VLEVKMNDKIIKATVVEKPFYDPKKKLASS
jgi:aminomethyltransferase